MTPVRNRELTIMDALIRDIGGLLAGSGRSSGRSGGDMPSDMRFPRDGDPLGEVIEFVDRLALACGLSGPKQSKRLADVGRNVLRGLRTEPLVPIEVRAGFFARAGSNIGAHAAGIDI